MRGDYTAAEVSRSWEKHETGATTGLTDVQERLAVVEIQLSETRQELEQLYGIVRALARRL